jgi:hypothetical protein
MREMRVEMSVCGSYPLAFLTRSPLSPGQIALGPHPILCLASPLTLRMDRMAVCGIQKAMQGSKDKT